MFLDLGLGECPDRELLTITNEVRFRSTRLGRIWWQFGKNKRVVAASTESEEIDVAAGAGSSTASVPSAVVVVHDQQARLLSNGLVGLGPTVFGPRQWSWAEGNGASYRVFGFFPLTMAQSSYFWSTH